MINQSFQSQQYNQPIGNLSSPQKQDSLKNKHFLQENYIENKIDKVKADFEIIKNKIKDNLMTQNTL